MALHDTYFGAGSLHGTIREDLLDFITNISPEDTPFLSMLQTSVAKSTNHIWLEDSLINPVAALSKAEGAAFSSGTMVDPVRFTNFTEIVRQDFEISGTMDAVDHAGMANQSAYQAMKAMKDVGNAIEFSLIQGQQNAGSTGVARVMDGLQIFADSSGAIAGPNDGNGATNVTAVGADGPTEPELVTGLEAIWNNGARADTALVNSAMKKGISGFTTTTRIHHQGGPDDPHKISRNIMQFESDFGTIDIFLERYVDALDTGYIFQRDLLATAWLRPIRMERLAKAGDSERYMIYGELTLEARAPGGLNRFVIA